MDAISLRCKLCDEKTRLHESTEQGIAHMADLYVSHLVESHWDLLEFARRQRIATGVPVNDAWTRL